MNVKKLLLTTVVVGVVMNVVDFVVQGQLLAGLYVGIAWYVIAGAVTGALYSRS